MTWCYTDAGDKFGVTWGDAEDGGDSSDVEGQLVKAHIHASGGALAAPLGEIFAVICRDSS